MHATLATASRELARGRMFSAALAAVLASSLLAGWSTAAADDHVRRLQAAAIEQGRADWGHWGPRADQYNGWYRHSNRLIPVYTYGLTLEDVSGAHSPYRSSARLTELFGRVPDDTLNPEAPYFDQTDIYHLQRRAAEAGKKQIILVIFDGMDWQTTWAAAIYRTGDVAYREGRGHGLDFQDYRGAVTDFGWFVTTPYGGDARVDPDAQLVTSPIDMSGGYNWRRGGSAPWDEPADPLYLLGTSRAQEHTVTDSASSATSLTAGIKTYNNAINVDHQGRQVPTIAHQLQREGWAIGVVTSVPISHATPAAAYAHNVTRNDFQDLTRDLVGLPSAAHRGEPLPGVDVLLGAGWGEVLQADAAQGVNFVPGNRYLTDDDRRAVDRAHGGRYVVAERTEGRPGREVLSEAVAAAREAGARLLGFFGAPLGFRGGSHLPFQTADGNYDPVPGLSRRAEQYSPADLNENPTLAELTAAALDVLADHPRGFWLMVEAGDVDWANHDNNIDNSIGAVRSGDEAFRTIVDWVERRDAWDDTALIVTADHGHYLVLTRPEALAGPAESAAGGGAPAAPEAGDTRDVPDAPDAGVADIAARAADTADVAPAGSR